MFSGIKPTGAYPFSGVSPYSTPATAAEHNKISAQNYDQLLFSPQPEGEEGRVRAAVAQISQQSRIRPTHHELSLLQQQIQSGTYQYDPPEIAARMLLVEA